jgi:hypothetical protein
MKRYRALCRRGPSALPTGEAAYFCLPTLTASRYGTTNNGSPGDGRKQYATKGKPSLHTMARRVEGPTLTSTGNLLSPYMQRWPAHRRAFGPTLLKSDATRGYLKRAMELRDQQSRGPRMSELFPGVLSPTWCEQYMGFPIGWTELPPSEIPSCPNAPKSSGTSSEPSKDGER